MRKNPRFPAYFLVTVPLNTRICENTGSKNISYAAIILDFIRHTKNNISSFYLK